MCCYPQQAHAATAKMKIATTQCDKTRGGKNGGGSGAQYGRPTRHHGQLLDRAARLAGMALLAHFSHSNTHSNTCSTTSYRRDASWVWKLATIPGGGTIVRFPLVGAKLGVLS
jgi:hypothetical protein